MSYILPKKFFLTIQEMELSEHGKRKTELSKKSYFVFSINIFSHISGNGTLRAWKMNKRPL